MTKFKMQYEGSVDGFYAMLDKLANDSRVSIKVEMEVTMDDFVHPPYPSEDWGDPYYWDDEASSTRNPLSAEAIPPPKAEQPFKQVETDWNGVPASSPPAEQPFKTLGEILKEKLGDKLSSEDFYKAWSKREWEGLGQEYDGWNATFLAQQIWSYNWDSKIPGPRFMKELDELANPANRKYSKLNAIKEVREFIYRNGGKILPSGSEHKVRALTLKAAKEAVEAYQNFRGWA